MCHPDIKIIINNFLLFILYKILLIKINKRKIYLIKLYNSKFFDQLNNLYSPVLIFRNIIIIRKYIYEISGSFRERPNHTTNWCSGPSGPVTPGGVV